MGIHGPHVLARSHFSSAGVAECVDKVAAVKGIEILLDPPEGENDEIGITQRVCAAWDVMMAGIEAAGVNPTTQLFLEGGYALGEFAATGFESVQMAEGRAFLGNVDPALYLYNGTTGVFDPLS